MGTDMAQALCQAPHPLALLQAQGPQPAFFRRPILGLGLGQRSGVVAAAAPAASCQVGQGPPPQALGPATSPRRLLRRRTLLHRGMQRVRWLTAR